ncbi:hypothetical protein BH09BAC3_BH09BAC3_24660 [soil metagenome]
MAKTKGKTENKDLTANEKNHLQADLRRFGYLLPTNDEELEEFNNIFGKTQVMFPDHLKRPAFLQGEGSSAQPNISPKVEKVVATKSKKPLDKNRTSKATKNDYFKRLVLAAEIANKLHEEPTFGHIKFVKIYFLCDHVCNMKFSSIYDKYAAGPLDAKQMHSIDAEFKKRKWFTITKSKYGFRYNPDEKLSEYQTYYEGYFKNSISDINKVIDLFRNKKSDFCEIVATIFYIQKDFILNHKLVNNASLIKDFYDWDEKKKRFSKSEILQAIDWMNENEIIPV